MSLLAENNLPYVLEANGYYSNKPVGGYGVLIPAYETEQYIALTATQATSTSVFVCDSISGTYQIAAVSAVFGTGSSSGTLQVEVATGTQAIGSGTNQLTGTIATSGTGSTTANGTLIASPTPITAGSRVNLIFAGTQTNLVNLVVNIVLQKIA